MHGEWSPSYIHMWSNLEKQIRSKRKLITTTKKNWSQIDELGVLDRA